MGKAVVISMQNVTFQFGENKILENWNLDLKEKTSYCLVGKSGSGKTTILRLMNGLLSPNQGEISVLGEKLSTENSTQIRRGLGYFIQGGGLFPHLTVKENLELIAKKVGWDQKKRNQRTIELCELLSLPNDTEFLSKKPRKISGGQQQRVGLARSLFLNPPILLMDEPFGALDPITRQDIQDEVIKIQQRLGLTIVLVTHDMAEAFYMADEVILLNKGKIEQHDRPNQLLISPKSKYVKEFLSSFSPKNRLKEIRIDTFMSTNLKNLDTKQKSMTIENNKTLFDALKMILDNQLHSLPVVDQNN
ncbi:MAG: ABC transporter ATP-binding protein, partial [Pseudomonadota bacterium]